MPFKYSHENLQTVLKTNAINLVLGIITLYECMNS